MRHLPLLFLCVCRTPNLEAVRPERQALDNLLQINANVCTKPSDPTLFPVKVVLIIDTSRSMSATDVNQDRVVAVRALLERFQGNPAVQFSVIQFSSGTTLLNEFTSAPAIDTIANALIAADGVTDYQGALGKAYSVISLDMQQASPAERARTKYLVIFFTDGTPDPQCSAKLGQGADRYLICDYPRDDWASIGATHPELFTQLQNGGDYNQPEQLYKEIDDIVGLQDAYRVGEVRLHTALLYPANLPPSPLIQAWDLDRPKAVALLSGIAEHGHGTFTEFTDASQINFLNFNYTTIEQPYAMADLQVTNVNALFADDMLQPDTDGDGIPDDTEFDHGSCAGVGARCQNPADSDGDGFGDLFETLFVESGFNIMDRTKPATACNDRNDSDGDGLKNCEEAFLGTNPRLFDSDGDRLTDNQEMRWGLDPLDPNDAQADADKDGMRNIDEIRLHLNPNVRNRPDGETDVRYSYTVEETETRPDGSTCYKATVKNVKLVTTGTGTDSPRGRSRIMLSFIEAPNDRPLDFGDQRVACVDVRYIENALKSPANGVIELNNANFVLPTRFSPDRDCVKADAP